MNKIEIYAMNDAGNSLMNIKPSTIKREWMDETAGLAYRCIPLNIANEYGWVCHSPVTFTATWNGGSSPDSITIVSHGDGPEDFCKTHFGHGIITLPPDFIVKTPKNISIYVRGLTNTGYENIYPLDGLVETDWLPFTFTMNYKFIKPGSITFKKGDPLFMFFPIDRTFIESFSVQQKSLYNNKELYENYQKYGKSRQEHIDNKTQKAQKFYVGSSIVEDKVSVENHKIKLKLSQAQTDPTSEI
jgi:hypothetical protein